MIRITVERSGKGDQVREFSDVNAAGLYWIGEAGIRDADVRKVTWENFPDCEHYWMRDEASVLPHHYYCGCGAKIAFSPEEITEFAKIKGRL